MTHFIVNQLKLHNLIEFQSEVFNLQKSVVIVTSFLFKKQNT